MDKRKLCQREKTGPCNEKKNVRLLQTEKMARKVIVVRKRKNRKRQEVQKEN